MIRIKHAGIWAFNALLALGALAFAFGLSKFSDPLIPAPNGMPWPIMIFVVAAGEVCMFSVRYKNDSQTFSLGEIAYVFGTVFYPPKQFLLCTAVGLTIVYLVRRVPATRLAFNVAATSLVTCVVVALCRAMAGDNPSVRNVWMWFGLVLGSAVACAMQAGLVGVVRSIAERRVGALADARRIIFFSELNGIAVASMGVLIAVVATAAPAVALMGAVPLLLLYSSFRQLVREHTLRANVEFLYETAQSIHNTPDIEKALTSLLVRSRKSFHADFGTVLLRRSDTDQWMSFSDGETMGGVSTFNMTPTWIPEPGRALAISRRTAKDNELRMLDQLKANLLLISTLTVDGEQHGLLIVADRGETGFDFSELDRHLFELLANQVAIGVENSQLERSLGVLTRLEEEMRHQANHDALTGLANRTLLTSVLKRSTGTERAVLLIDLDDFKTINDSLGHAAGDEVLIEVARRLKSAVREGDLVSRLGGDEFAIILGAGASQSRAVEAAERVSMAIAPPMDLLGRQVAIHASIGIAAAASGVELDELLRSADVAMYQAKNAGKGRHMLFESGMDEAARQRLQIITGLRTAAERDEISVEYQPIIDLQTRTTVAVEALLRWKHSELGVLGPDRFIPLAEESGVIPSIGAWVLNRACRDVAPLVNEYGHPLELHVNVSPQQIEAQNFVSIVTNALTEANMAHPRLILEITEKTALADSEAVMKNVRELRALNIQLALDDFGTGYSSLAAAHNFPLDLIKIDQLFVRAIDASSEASLVRAILAMADSLGLAPVAEGIETEEQLQKLIQLGCPFGQGYLFSKALTLDNLHTWQTSNAAFAALA
jgi:diguanylate cyclase (GGDEF)-like protein